MASFNLVTTNNTNFSKGDSNVPYVAQAFLDFAVNPAGSSSDTYKLIAIPAGATILATMVNVVKVCTTSFTFELGDSGSATRYYGTGTATSSTGIVSPTTLTPHNYSAVDYILLTCQAATAIVGQLAITVLMANMNYTAAAGVASL